jgi:hypothetical protein
MQVKSSVFFDEKEDPSVPFISEQTSFYVSPQITPPSLSKITSRIISFKEQKSNGIRVKTNSLISIARSNIYPCLNRSCP